jgi:hypothetical protein
MHCLELSRVPAKVICVLRVVHLPDLILGQLHIVELMVSIAGSLHRRTHHAWRLLILREGPASLEPRPSWNVSALAFGEGSNLPRPILA